MGSKNAELCAEEHPTVLTGRRDDVTFEVSVEIKDKPLRVHGASDMEDNSSEAWIASENGKRYTVCMRVKANPITADSFKDFRADIFCDGQLIRRILCTREIDGSKRACAGQSVSGKQVHPLLFSTPTLIEEDPTKKDMEKLGTIEVVFNRGTRSNSRAWVDSDVPRKVKLGEAVSERAKKALGSRTMLGDIVTAEKSNWWEFAIHPDDKDRGYFRIVFHYGPEDLLRAQGHIPRKLVHLVRNMGFLIELRNVKVKDGRGTSERNAVIIDDGEDVKNGRTVSKAPKKKDGGDQKVPSEKARELEVLRERLKELEEIAELKAKIRALEDDIGHKSNTKATASSNGGKADGGGRVAKKARNGGT